MNAFIAWTPLHVINIVNAAVNQFEGQRNHLFLYDEFAGARGLYERLQQEQVFERVELIPHDSLGNPLERIGALLFNRQKWVELEEPYDHITVPGENYFAKVLYGQVHKRNPKVQLHYIEDGLGAYDETPILREDLRTNRIVKALNRHSMYRAEFASCYVYEPELVMAEHAPRYERLRRLTKSNPALDVVKRLFPAENGDADLCGKVLYFDQPFLADGFAIDEKELMDELRAMVPEERLLVKFHPRSPRDKYGNVPVLDTHLPWEVYCLHHPIEDGLFISVATTAAFTPYLMFGIESPVIKLAAIYQERLKDAPVNEMTSTLLRNTVDFVEQYQAKTGAEIFMPQTMDELNQFIQQKMQETDAKDSGHKGKKG